MATAATTAIEAWDRRWATSEGRADWLDPEPESSHCCRSEGARGPHHSAVITGIDAFIATSAAEKYGVQGPRLLCENRAPRMQRQALCP